jgi:hypothetical protein
LTPLRIKIDPSDEDKKVHDSIRMNGEFDSDEIDGSDSQHETQPESRISILLEIPTSNELEKWRISL